MSSSELESTDSPVSEDEEGKIYQCKITFATATADTNNISD